MAMKKRKSNGRKTVQVKGFSYMRNGKRVRVPGYRRKK